MTASVAWGSRPSTLRGAPVLFIVFIALLLAFALAQSAALLAGLERSTRGAERTRYEVTDLRVRVISGRRSPRTWSAYLYQLSPVVRPNADGSADLWLRPDGPGGLRDGFGDVPPGLKALDLFGLGSSDRPACLVLSSPADARLAEQAIRTGRKRMAGHAPADPGTLTGPAPGVSTPVPAAVRLAEGEQVLWAGRPGRAPWWFGWQDAGVCVVGVPFLVMAALIGTGLATSATFLVALVPVVSAALYLTAGRVVLRRLRVRRSTYVVTDRRLVTVWQLGIQPVVVQAPLGGLFPPRISHRTIFTRLVRPAPAASGRGWRDLAWPAATSTPPAFVGLADPVAVRDLIAAAQLAVPAAARVR